MMHRTNGNKLTNSAAITPVGADSCGGVNYVATIITPGNASSYRSMESMEGQEVKGAKAHAKRLADEALDKAREVKGAFVYRASEFGQSLSNNTSSAKKIITEKASELTSSVRDTDYHGMVMAGRKSVRRDPVKSLMIAAGLGLAVGLMMSRRH